VQLYQSRNIAKMAAIKPQIDELSAVMRESSQKGTPKGLEDAEKARVALSKLFAKHQVRPWLSIVGALCQLPLWITFFFTMRHMTREGAGLGFETGGALWFNDLTVPDPYYAMPLAMGASFFTMAQLGDAGQAPGAALDPRQAQMKTMMKLSAFAMVPLTSSFPSGVFVYWISTNLTSIVQTILLRQPAVRSFVGMPAPAAVSVAAAAAAAPQQDAMASALSGMPVVSGLLGLTPAASTSSPNPMAPAPREPVRQNTAISLGGSSARPSASPAKAKPKAKKRRR
jgi:YidC/Oxa1 family membrane protein insertase